MELDNVVAFLAGKAAGGGGGGGDITVEPLSVTENGTTTAPDGKAYTPVTVNVPNSYSASDEGKVVDNGALVAQTSTTVTQNGLIDTTLINSLTVNVGVNWDGFAAGTWPTGEAVLSNSVTNIARQSFCYDGGITGISGPEVQIVNEWAITNCANLATLNLPKVTRIGEATNNARAAYTIANCPKLRTIHLPELLTANCGYNLSGLGETNGFVTIVLPKVTFLGTNNLRNVKAEAIDIGPDLTTLPQSGINGGTYNNIILRRTAGVVTADASGAINGVTSSTKVWVPSALIDSYKAASNWSTKGDVFYAIEGSIYEHAYADGTPIPTT